MEGTYEKNAFLHFDHGISNQKKVTMLFALKLYVANKEFTCTVKMKGANKFLNFVFEINKDKKKRFIHAKHTRNDKNTISAGDIFEMIFVFIIISRHTSK